MGGRLRGMICGGAPIDPVVSDRMTAYFSAPLMQGYGLTESFGPCFLAHPDDAASGYIGGVWPAVEFKIVSVPELNYLVTDKPPRGELCLRGPGVAVGYFRNKEETESVWDQEGWFHTGDICTLHPKTLAVAIIDRKKNIFKLAQGEYIAPEKIEAVYGQALLVSQIFVFGYSAQVRLEVDFPLAFCDFSLFVWRSLCRRKRWLTSGQIKMECSAIYESSASQMHSKKQSRRIWKKLQ